MDGKKKSRDWFGVIVGFIVCVPILVLFDVMGWDSGRGRAAAVATGVIITSAKVSWELHRKLWYWLVLVALSVVHIFLVSEVEWSDRALSWAALLPFGALDFAIVYGAIRLAQKLTTLFRRQ